jgi:hypothetical protein
VEEEEEEMTRRKAKKANEDQKNGKKIGPHRFYVTS